MRDLSSMLVQVIDRGGSDLHLKVGERPLIRVHGALDWLDDDSKPMEAWQTERILHELLPEPRVREFERTHERDFSYSPPGLPYSFRVNACVQRGTVALSLRVISDTIRSVRELGLPDIVRDLAEEQRGIILVTGSTGCGKSTTLAAMVRHINETMRKRVITIEDPIEYLHRDIKASIVQREVGSDTESFEVALRRALRQDPDVILVGEMRDEETIRTALSAAETGHLVLSTLHTIDATETINRILDFFPAREQQQARAMLAGSLKAIVSQRLVPHAEGQGRVAIAEILTTTGRVRDMIVEPAKTERLPEAIATGEYYGMQTFDQALHQALLRTDISMEDALSHATHPHDLKLLIDANGKHRTTMADVPQGQ